MTTVPCHRPHSSARRQPVATPYRRGLLLLLPLLLLAPPLLARSSDRGEPIRIEAGRVEIDEPRGVSIYRQDVVLQQGSLQLNADQLTIELAQGQLQRATAIGTPARFQQQPAPAAPAVAGHATSILLQRSDNDLILLEGDAVVTRGRDRFSGGRIRYYPDTNRVAAEGDGSGRVEAIIYPTAAAPQP